MKTVYIVEEIGFYGTSQSTKAMELHHLSHICATEELAKKRLQEWIDKSHPLPEDIDWDNKSATCYYDEVPWKVSDVSFENFQTSERSYVYGGCYGSVESCMYYEHEVEEE